MKVLLAEDDAVARRLLRAHLDKWGYETISARDGAEAWTRLREDRNVGMAILDWMMPELDGIELCRRIRAHCTDRPIYVLLCTARNDIGDIVSGLDAGADDYLTKPLRTEELRARLRVGVRTLALETALFRRIAELDLALAHVRRLQGLLPICMHCRRIRNEAEVWQRLETYVEDHADVQFSHGVCESCLHEHHPQVRAK